MDTKSTESSSSKEERVLPWQITRLICSILAIACGIYLVDNSGAIKLVQLLTQQGGATGELLGYLCIAGGIIGIYTYIKKDMRGMLAGAICYLVGALLSLDAGPYEDLYIFDAIAVVFAVVTFIAWLKAKKATA